MFYFPETLYFCFWYSGLSEPHGLKRPEGLDELRTFIHLIGSQTRDLPASSTVLQPLMLEHTPYRRTDRKKRDIRKENVERKAKYQQNLLEYI
jgi:hypothetical protein